METNFNMPMMSNAQALPFASAGDDGCGSVPMIIPPARPRTDDEMIAVGRALDEARALLGRQFESWVAEHCDFSVRSSYRYIAAADEADRRAQSERDLEAAAIHSAWCSKFSPTIHGEARMTDEAIDALANMLIAGHGDNATWVHRARFKPAFAEAIVCHPNMTCGEFAKALKRATLDVALVKFVLEGYASLFAGLPADGLLASAEIASEALGQPDCPF